MTSCSLSVSQSRPRPASWIEIEIGTTPAYAVDYFPAPPTHLTGLLGSHVVPLANPEVGRMMGSRMKRSGLVCLYHSIQISILLSLVPLSLPVTSERNLRDLDLRGVRGVLFVGLVS